MGLSPEYQSLLPLVLCGSVLIAPGLEEELQCVSQEDWGVGEVLIPAGERLSSCSLLGPEHPYPCGKPLSCFVGKPNRHSGFPG